MFRSFAESLAQAQLSNVLKEYSWIVPTSQSVHIVSVGLLFTSAIAINMRVLGLARAERSVSQLLDALAPWMWGALAALLATGTIQTVAEPVRQFVAPLFWIKMALIVIVVLMTVGFMHVVRRHASAWDAADQRPPGALPFAVVSTLLWVSIIVCGRFIGYTWSYYA
jgi:hypothetical protein